MKDVQNETGRTYDNTSLHLSIMDHDDVEVALLDHDEDLTPEVSIPNPRSVFSSFANSWSKTVANNPEKFTQVSVAEQNQWLLTRDQLIARVFKSLVHFESYRNWLIEELSDKRRKAVAVLSSDGDITYSEDYVNDVCYQLLNVDEECFTLVAERILSKYKISYKHCIGSQATNISDKYFPYIKQFAEQLKSGRIGMFSYNEDSESDFIEEINDAEKLEGINFVLIAQHIRIIKPLSVRINDIRGKLVNTNIKMCISVANKLCKNLSTESSFTIDDAYMEAVVGFQKGIDSYILGSKAVLTTYSHQWVQTQIQRALDRHQKCATLPAHFQTDVKAVLKVLISLKGSQSEHEFSVAAAYDEVQEVFGRKLTIEAWEQAVNLFRSINQDFRISHGSDDFGLQYQNVTHMDMGAEHEASTLIAEMDARKVLEIAKSCLSADRYTIVEGYMMDEPWTEISTKLYGTGKYATPVRRQYEKAIEILRQELERWGYQNKVLKRGA
jgi:DNA-directed RNA polymerase specialized sigma subunit